ncbi:ribonuclease III, partial [Salmonella enterica]|nr:ribonuclease III [Salmonella enterica]
SSGVPEYQVDEEGPDHEKTFHARAVVGEEVLGTGTGRSKKEAEQKAAELAWRALTARAARLAPQEDGAGTASA